MWFSLKNTDFSSSGGVIDFIFAILILIFAVVFPLLTYRFLKRNHEDLPTVTTKAKYDSLYQNLDYFKKRSIMNTSLFLMRRTCFAFVIIFCSSSIVLQVAMADVFSTLLLAYHLSVFPMMDRLNNAIQIFNECAVLVCIWLMFHFTPFVGSPHTRYDLAWGFLYFIAIVAGINFVFLLWFIVKKLYWALWKYFAKKRKSKK